MGRKTLSYERCSPLTPMLSERLKAFKSFKNLLKARYAIFSMLKFGYKFDLSRG